MSYLFSALFFWGEAWCRVNISSDVTAAGKNPHCWEGQAALIREKALSVYDSTAFEVVMFNNSIPGTTWKELSKGGDVFCITVAKNFVCIMIAESRAV